MPRLPRNISGRDLAGALVRLGFVVSRQRGSHMVLHRSDPACRVVVPDHVSLKIGTLKSVLREAGVSVEVLLEAMK